MLIYCSCNYPSFPLKKGGIILKTCLDEFNHTIILNLCKISTYSISLENYIFCLESFILFHLKDFCCPQSASSLYIFLCCTEWERLFYPFLLHLFPRPTYAMYTWGLFCNIKLLDLFRLLLL